MAGIRNQPYIQQEASIRSLRTLREQKIAHAKARQAQEKRAHNTVLYRKNLLVDQMMAAFDRWAKGFLGLWQ